MKRLGWAVALLVAFTAPVVISAKQLGEDASPAAGFCAKAEKAGYTCVVSPTTFDAQVVQTDDGMGSVGVVLIISDGKKIIQVIPLQ